MSKWFIEIVKDFNGVYYCNLTVAGELIKELPEYVDYNTLKEAIRLKTGIKILPRNKLVWQKDGRKSYAYIDATQPCKNGCVVTLEEIKAGHKPNWDEKPAESAKPVYTNWCKAMADPFEAISALIQCLNSGYNAWIEVQKNGEQDLPFKVKNPALDDPHNWKSACGYIPSPQEMANKTFFNKTEEDLFYNWTEVFSTKAAADEYKKTGGVSEGLVCLATDKYPYGIRCNVRKDDATHCRKTFGKQPYNYVNSPFYNMWVPAVEPYIVDESIDKVFVICYSEEPCDIEKKITLAADFLKETAKKLKEENK